jgi:hypothetical protein
MSLIVQHASQPCVPYGPMSLSVSYLTAPCRVPYRRVAFSLAILCVMSIAVLVTHAFR